METKELKISHDYKFLQVDSKAFSYSQKPHTEKKTQRKLSVLSIIGEWNVDGLIGKTFLPDTIPEIHWLEISWLALYET